MTADPIDRAIAELLDDDAQPSAQKRTHSELSDAQVAAIAALLGGATRDEAATAAGVRPEQVSRWRNHHPGFRAALADARADLLGDVANAVTDLVLAAVTKLAERVEEGDDMALRLVLAQLPPSVFAEALQPRMTTEREQLDLLARRHGVSPESYPIPD